MTAGTMAGEGVIALDDPRAEDPARAGAKAAALARARRSGLAVLPGFVITTDVDSDPSAIAEATRPHWQQLTDDGRRSLVVRSSSPIEDRADSSMAGRFTTVVGVSGWDEFTRAVGIVLESALQVALEDGRAPGDAAMAVLVQPLVEPRAGGVLFGVDPVTGRSDRRVVTAVSGMPERLVSGETSGAHYELDPSGRRVSFDPGDDDIRLTRRELQELVALADRAAEVFGGPDGAARDEVAVVPQDIEWAIEDDGRVWLLQSRPVTTEVTGIPSGPVFGPGPVSETFPDPLSILEADLWVSPLRDALAEVLQTLGLPTHDEPLVVVVDGRVAMNLDVLEVSARAPWWAFIRRTRMIRSAWRIGRLRLALPDLAADTIDAADKALFEVQPAEGLTDRQLIATLKRCREALVSLHAHEMLIGMVLGIDAKQLTASSVALRVLDHARSEGLADKEIPARFPIVLALVPPRVCPGVVLPPEIALPAWEPADEDMSATLREALRLRVRWMQELAARYTWTLGQRLAERGDLAAPPQVQGLDLAALEMTVRRMAVTHHERLDGWPPTGRPLPARFRLSDLGRPVPVTEGADGQATGAGGGRGEGPVHLDLDDVPDGAVLIVRTLDGRLAPILPRLNGLVAETGSVLAHVAILAREANVPTVVAMPGATTRFEPGTIVTVDGATGDVAASSSLAEEAPS